MQVFVLALALALSGASVASDPVAVPRAALQRAVHEAAARPAPLAIAREQFLRQPAIGNVQLSPDGRNLSFAKRDGDSVDVWLQAIADGTPARVLAGARGVEHAWSGDGARLWLADEQGLAVVDPHKRQATRIVKWDRTRRQRYWAIDARATAYALIVETIERDGAPQHRYLLVDATGKTRLLHESTQPLRKVLLDEGGALVYAAAFDGPNYDTVIRRFTPNGVRELARCVGVEMCEPVAFSAKREALWMLAQRGEDKLVLQRWQATDGHWDVLHRDPLDVADADALLWKRENEDWQAIGYYRERRHWYGNTSDTQAQLAALQRHLPGANLQLSSSRDGRVWLIRAQQSDWPIDRHALYWPARDRWQALFDADDAATPALSQQPLATAQPVAWRASDGVLLHGYVYLPSGIDARRAPLIAWLHGGPFGRLHDDYDERLQLLANRGYAVFLPNFRASTGYGLNYMQAAQGDVGNGRVLRDVIEGLDFLLAQGIGDRDRQAVMGHSFGGYASLLAVTHYPTRFRFAFAGAAGSDYGWLKQWQAEHEGESLRSDGGGRPVAMSFEQNGLPFADATWREKMRRDSPLASIANLQVPIYLWAGAADDRVPIKSIVHYAAEVQRHGKALALLIDPDAGHAPRQPLSAEAWLFLMEQAAHRHFGGGVTPASPELKAFLQRYLRIDTQGLLSPAVN